MPIPLPRAVLLAALLSTLLLLMPSAIHAADAGDATDAGTGGRLALIKKRGEILVGVKMDYPPFGMLKQDGKPVGFEHDLAEDLAQQLGVKLHKVAVTGANRLQLLNDGRVDVVIATTGDTEERRRIATMVEPSYYSSGVTLMTRPDTTLTRWTDLRGQEVCATQGSYFNRTMTSRHLLSLQMYGNGRDAKLAVRDRRCIGWLFDSTAIAGDLRTPEWQTYKATLPLQLITPWSIAVARSESEGQLDHTIGDVVAAWHRNGFLIAQEQKWGLPPSDFLAQAHQRWSETGDDGAPVCRRDSAGLWPVQCRNPIFVTSAEVTGLRQFGLYIKEHTGLNLTFIYDDYERGHFLRGVRTTLALTIACVLGSLLAGIVFAILAEAHIAVASRAIRISALVSRMTPPLLQIYVLFFGIGSMVSALWNIRFSPFAVVVLCLSCTTGSSIMSALLHAAQARRAANPAFRLQLSTLAVAMVRSSAPVTAALVNVSKATMMASAISVSDLLSVSTSIIAEHGDVGVVMNTLMLFYLALSFSVIRLFRFAEKKGTQWTSAK